MHNQRIGSCCRQKRQLYGQHPILIMIVNRVSGIFSFASSVIYDPIGCRQLFMRYWQPLRAKTTVTCCLPHPENERKRSVNSFRSRIFRNQGIAQIFTHKTEFLTALIGKNTIYRTLNTDSKLIYIANGKSSKNVVLHDENAILIRYS